MVTMGKTETNTYILMQFLKRKLPNVVIMGLPSVARSVINEVSSEKRFELLVEGDGLREIMGADGVDGLNTTTNSTLECMKCLGIEAARYIYLRSDKLLSMRLCIQWEVTE
jgi:DNA-directed RNA polymerase III subunit RPC1